jgi:hypothetical protein
VSRKLVDLSPDLKRLRDEGYHVDLVGDHLVVRDIPYVTSARQVARGALVSVLELLQDRTQKPNDHSLYFDGEPPCDGNGNVLTDIVIDTNTNQLAPGVAVRCRFSSKPTHGRGYADYYEKITTYAKVLGGHARAVDPQVTAKTFPVIPESSEAAPFKFVDTASSRAGIGGVSPRLSGLRVAIVGLGGTGAYVLDLVAKTPVNEIHLYDDDEFHQHSAFRAPGATSLEELRVGVKKVDRYSAMYSQMKNGIFPHAYRIDASKAAELVQMSFVFLCVDSGEEKPPIMNALEAAGIPFIDVGMGVEETAGALGGIVRVTASTDEKRDHVRDNGRISFAPPPLNAEHARNIQLADLNALNAAMAVVKWKKIFGFYHDLTKEHHSTFVIETGRLGRYDTPSGEDP